ncbi:MAG: 3-dehydroquinate synthase [Elusimicrobia bacterium]|nr:3-dehydroquinate synthase [Elusimicrobiota bacterium]
MKSINLKLKNNPYPIIFSNNDKDLIKSFKSFVPEKKVFVISDSNVAPLYLKKIEGFLKKEKFIVQAYVFKAGEQSKNLKTLSDIYNYALKVGVDRKFTVVALGGGVVGDTAGFFAATYMRGIKLVQVPTSLLAMVDSSVGGKTGVNVEGGKNIAGAFYQPKFVYINTDFLKTLDCQNIKNGMGEIVKYAVTFSKDFYNKLNKIFDKAVVTQKDFDEIVYQCCKFKADIVKRDEKEVSGVRELLNFGHTFAHALETITEYKKFFHGEAVAIGMLFVANLAEKIKFCTEKTKNEIYKIVENAGFCAKLGLKKTDTKKLLELMKKDKKSISKTVRFVLPKQTGKAVFGVEIKDNIILKTIEDFLK